MSLTWKSPDDGRCANGSCVAAAVTFDGRINVADAHGGVIELRPDAWNAILSAVRTGEYHRCPSIQRDLEGVRWLGVRPGSALDLVVLRYTADEWAAFTAAVRRGRFTIDDLAA